MTLFNSFSIQFSAFFSPVLLLTPRSLADRDSCYIWATKHRLNTLSSSTPAIVLLPISTPEQAMGRWVMGPWVKWVTIWMGHVGHGSVHVDPWPTIISSAQQVTGKCRQKFTVNTRGSFWIMIFQHSVISAFSIRWCRQLVVMQYLSVKCAVLNANALIVYMYNACDWLRSCVFVYMFPTLNVMVHGSYLVGHGSHVRWVNGSWVNSNDPLPALLYTYSNSVLVALAIYRLGVLVAVFAFISYRAFADRRGYLIMSLSRITTCRPTWSLQLSEINNIMYAMKHSIIHVCLPRTSF